MATRISSSDFVTTSRPAADKAAGLAALEVPMGNGIDLRKYSLGATGPSGIYATALKRDAQKEAVARGIGRSAVCRAYNRFNRFYVLAWSVGASADGVALMDFAGKLPGAENIVRLGFGESAPSEPAYETEEPQ
jgi:hypothetical protein